MPVNLRKKTDSRPEHIEAHGASQPAV